MLDQSRSALEMCACLLFILLLTSGQPVAAQAKETPQPEPDALAFLNAVFERYAYATTYDLESIEETTLNGEFSRLWTKSLATAIVGHSNQFHFEAQGDHGSGLQVSDGKTEWIYYPPLQQYIQHTVPSTGPSPIRAPVAPGLLSLNAAQRALKTLSNLRKLVRAAEYAPDASIETNGNNITCKVIEAEGEIPETSGHITTRFTFWIDKQTKVIRKMTEYREGPLHPTEPDMRYTMERKTLFLVADLSLSSPRDEAFTFKPPLTASQVERFEDRMSTVLREFVGEKAPEIILIAANGKDIPLKSFRGKPVLLDFWATWCAPCVESLPAIERLYQETAKNGLVLLSIDENEEPKTAEEFWSKHKEPWPNFHATADVLSQFPEHGIPYFVLIDASGKVAFSAAGLEETALRSAISKVGPEFAHSPKKLAP